MVPRRVRARPNRLQSGPHSGGEHGRDLKVIGEPRYHDLVLARNRALLAAAPPTWRKPSPPYPWICGAR